MDTDPLFPVIFFGVMAANILSFGTIYSIMAIIRDESEGKEARTTHVFLLFVYCVFFVLGGLIVAA